MARGYANVKFEWNDKASNIVKNLGFGKGLNKDAAEILYRNYYDYIPYSLQETSGNLANNVRIMGYNDHATITHLVRYANAQFNADEGNPYGKDVLVHRTRAINELATSHWSEWAWSMHKREITKEVDEARLKYRKPTKQKRSANPNGNMSTGDWATLALMILTGGGG